MRLVADVKIGRRSILRYVLNPLTRVLERACTSPNKDGQDRCRPIFLRQLERRLIANGVARLEFQRLQAAPGESRELRMVSEFVLAIPTQGLARTMTLLDGVRERLVRDGGSRRAPPRRRGGPGAARRRSPKFLTPP